MRKLYILLIILLINNCTENNTPKSKKPNKINQDVEDKKQKIDQNSQDNDQDQYDDDEESDDIPLSPNGMPVPPPLPVNSKTLPDSANLKKITAQNKKVITDIANNLFDQIINAKGNLKKADSSIEEKKEAGVPVEFHNLANIIEQTANRLSKRITTNSTEWDEEALKEVREAGMLSDTIKEVLEEEIVKELAKEEIKNPASSNSDQTLTPQELIHKRITSTRFAHSTKTAVANMSKNPKLLNLLKQQGKSNDPLSISEDEIQKLVEEADWDEVMASNKKPNTRNIINKRPLPNTPPSATNSEEIITTNQPSHHNKSRGRGGKNNRNIQNNRGKKK